MLVLAVIPKPLTMIRQDDDECPIGQLLRVQRRQ
jgi:hypothetical protein